MLPDKDIDAVLQDAQSAVQELAAVAHLNAAPASPSAGRATPSPAAAAARERLALLAGQPNMVRLLQMRVAVVVRLAQRRMRISEILQWTVGSIIEFDRGIDSELDLLVDRKCVGTGEPVKVGENFGLRVRYVGDLRSRIATLSHD